MKVNGNTNIGGVLSIAGISNVRTAIENAGGGTTYSAATNGGLALNDSNNFSIDLNNTNADFVIPQRVQIVNDATAQLIVKPSSSNGENAAISIRGARNGSTSDRQAQLRFENFERVFL